MNFYGGKMSSDWLDVVMVTGWVTAWAVLIYLIPAAGF